MTISMLEFLANPHYLGSFGPKVYSTVGQALIEVFDGGRPLSTVKLRGGRATGKTTFGLIAAAKALADYYEEPSHYSPQTVLFSGPTLISAEANLGKLKSMLVDSPYFMSWRIGSTFDTPRILSLPFNIRVIARRADNLDLFGLNLRYAFQETDGIANDLTAKLIADVDRRLESHYPGIWSGPLQVVATPMEGPSSRTGPPNLEWYA